MNGKEGKNKCHEKHIEQGNHADNCRYHADLEREGTMGPDPAKFLSEAPASSGRGIIKKHQGRIKGVQQKYCNLAEKGYETDHQGNDCHKDAEAPDFYAFEKISQKT